MVILGIDFGLKHVGLAIADDGLAWPLAVVANSPKLVDKILTVCQKNKVEKIVVGMPDGKLVGEVKEFARQLRETAKLPIEFQDETLTSRRAVGKMIAIGEKRKARREKQDAFAAAIILEEYLEKGEKGV